MGVGEEVPDIRGRDETFFAEAIRGQRQSLCDQRCGNVNVN